LFEEKEECCEKSIWKEGIHGGGKVLNALPTEGKRFKIQDGRGRRKVALTTSVLYLGM
jgi:hypothetical protein